MAKWDLQPQTVANQKYRASLKIGLIRTQPKVQYAGHRSGGRLRTQLQHGAALDIVRREKNGIGEITDMSDATATNGQDKHGFYFEDLSVGMSAQFTKTITESDIQQFADISGDDNPVHLCEDFAAASVFKERIAHGILTAGLLSAVLGTKLPGPGCIYVSQSLNFKGPVRIGDEVTANAKITHLVDERRRAVLSCECIVNEKVILDGEAVMLVPRRAS